MPVVEGNRPQSYAPAMEMTIESITEAVLSLPSDARALLADRLVESLDPLTDADIREAWSAEALLRLEGARSGRVRTIPAEEALARVRALSK